MPTFSGIEINVTPRFAEGSVLSAPEAKWANTQLSTVLGNYFSNSIRRALAAKTDEMVAAWNGKGEKPSAVLADLGTVDWQAKFDELAANYKPGESSRGGTTASAGSDTVARAMHNLATEATKQAIKSKGLKVTDFQRADSTDGKTSKFAELVTAYITRHPELRAIAEAQVAALASMTDDVEALPAVAA